MGLVGNRRNVLRVGGHGNWQPCYHLQHRKQDALAVSVVGWENMMSRLCELRPAFPAMRSELVMKISPALLFTHTCGRHGEPSEVRRDTTFGIAGADVRSQDEFGRQGSGPRH